MQNESAFLQNLANAGRALVLGLMCLFPFGQQANAQGALPEGVIGWYFYGPGSGNFAPDPVTACQYSAINHMGTNLKEMRVRPGATIPMYDCKYPHFIGAGGEAWYALTYLECAAGYIPRWPGICTKNEEKALIICCDPSDPGYAIGNPVVIATGDKVQVESDPIGPLQDPLRILRTYRTFGEPGGSLGSGWSFSFDRVLTTEPHNSGQPPVYVYGVGDQGSYFKFGFDYVNLVYQPYTPNSGTLKPVNALYEEWIYTNPAGRMDHFKMLNGSYKVVSSHTKEGFGQYFAYDVNNRLQTITDSFGRVLQVVWRNDYVIDSITGPDVSVHYEYELASIPTGALIVGTERLVRVLVKDAAGALLTSKEYHYEDSRYRFLMTGITDENANRYATYSYNDSGKAVLSEHAGGAARHTFSYVGETSRAVADPLGTIRTYSLATLNGYGRITSIVQPGGAGYGVGSRSFTYDGQKNPSTISDFNGNKTCYAFDPVRSLETGRIEGVDAAAVCPSIGATSLTGSQRKILTQWHPDARVEVKVSGPKRRTSYIYNGQADANGQTLTCAPATALPDSKPIVVLCKRVEQATSDSSGAAGFNATPVGMPRIWTFTYNALGQMLTSNGPVGASGGSESMAYTYYSDTTATHTLGDLATATNAFGHLTEYLEYNKSGKVTKVRDPNGSITVLTYDPQQRLTSRTIGAETAAARTTTYAYDNVGQLTRVTAPDTSYIAYTYDAAHRLTDISDGLGNTIHYTLDNSGNRIREEVRDASGSLSRQVVRAFDPLGRLQEVTGSAR